MILAALADADRYAPLLPGLAAGFEFLRRTDLDHLEPGRFDLEAGVFALVERAAGRGTAGARLEVHRRYLDIQYSLDGRERIGWRRSPTANGSTRPTTKGGDIAFYADSPAVWLPLALGHFLIFFPTDAHAPLAGEGPLGKVVIKVPLLAG